MVLGKALESALDYREIQPVNAKGDQSWIFIGRTDVEAEAPILWPTDVKNWLIIKDPIAGKDWRQVEKRSGTEELPHVRGQGRWPKGASPRLKSGAVAVWVQEGWEELLHVQGHQGQPWEDTHHLR